MSKHVIVTGAAGNLGRAVVKRFSDDGYRVIAVDSPGRTDGITPSERVEVYPVDLVNEGSVEAFVKTVQEKYGTLDAALLLAGGYAGGGVAETDGKALRDMVSLNFETAYHMARRVFLRMTAQPDGGRIVLIGARAALEPAAGKRSLAYSLSKSMLFTLASMLNAEGDGSNVVVSVVVPSTIDTPANRESMPKADFSRWVRPEKIAGILAFLVSEDAGPVTDPVVKVYG